MHTLTVICGGFALLGVCMLASALLGSSIGKAASWFMPLWLIGAGVNMWVGVSRAGYTVAQEFPIFLVVFGLPAIAALLVHWRYGR